MPGDAQKGLVPDIWNVLEVPVSRRHGQFLNSLHMSHSLNSLKGGYTGDYIGDLLYG